MSLYDAKKIVEQMVRLECNRHYIGLAYIVDFIATLEASGINGPLYVADLGAGAHPQYYKRLMQRVVDSLDSGSIDWVDASSYMLDWAKENCPQLAASFFRFLHGDMIEYLEELPSACLSMVLMKYTLNFLSPHVLNNFFQLVKQKLTVNGRFIATISIPNGILRGSSKSVRYVCRDKEISTSDFAVLGEGEAYKASFYINPDRPDEGYVGEVELFYHSIEILRRLAERIGFHYFFGDWRGLTENIPEGLDSRDAFVMILRKK